MEFNQIKTMTYIENTVTIDGTALGISTSCEVEAVQFHKGRNYCIEEPEMIHAPLSEYQYVLDEFAAVKDKIDNPTIIPLTTEQITSNYQDGITNFIQSKVTKYNKLEKLSLKDVYTCKLYAETTGYTHQDFCSKVWLWNVSVWEFTRAEFIKVFNSERIMPESIEDLIAELPLFDFDYGEENAV